MTYSQAYNTTLEQFASYQKAFEIQTVDSIHLMARNAWLNQSAKATKGKGKNIRSAYRDFQDFFDWDLDGTADHVGIVIGTDGSRVYTVEGNSGDACKIKSYDLNYQSIKGYGLMNW